MNQASLRLPKLMLMVGVLLLTLPSSLPAMPGKIFRLLHCKTHTELPFRLVDDLIIVAVSINGTQHLNFILDTGTNAPIILNKKYIEDLNLPLGRTVSFRGAGKGTAVTGRVVSKMSLQIGDAVADHVGAVVLDKNPLSTTRINGIKIHGIIGGTLFHSFAVEIDYPMGVIRLHENDQFLEEHTYSRHEMTVSEDRPILKATIGWQDQEYPLDLMIDTGFNHHLLLYPEGPVRNFTKGRRLVGRGYSGAIWGSTAAIRSLQMANRRLFDVHTFFPVSASYQINSDRKGERDGLIGNALLKQFCIVLDYANSKFYIQEHLLNHPAVAHEKFLQPERQP